MTEISPNKITALPQPPYYAVIFTSVRTLLDKDYEATSNRMLDLASQQPGFFRCRLSTGKHRDHCVLLEKPGIHSKLEKSN